MKPIPAADPAFWSRVSKADECWIWTGGRSQQGYGKWGTAKQNSRDMLERHPRFQRPRRRSLTFRIERRERERIEALAAVRNESISDTVDYLLRKAIALRAEKKREAGQ